MASPALLAAVVGLHEVLPWPVVAPVTATDWKRWQDERAAPAPDGARSLIGGRAGQGRSP